MALKRISEATLGVLVEGKKVDLAQIEGADVEIHRVGFGVCELGPVATVVIKNGDEWAWFSCVAANVVEALEGAKDDLPILGRFTSHQSKNDRTFWTVE